MSRFFVGQRVLLARGLDLVSVAKLYGLQGRIQRFEFIPAGTLCRDLTLAAIDCDCCVEWDGDAYASIQHSGQLEPILPEGQHPSEYTFAELMESLGSEVAA